MTQPHTHTWEVPQLSQEDSLYDHRRIFTQQQGHGVIAVTVYRYCRCGAAQSARIDWQKTKSIQPWEAEVVQL